MPNEREKQIRIIYSSLRGNSPMPVGNGMVVGEELGLISSGDMHCGMGVTGEVGTDVYVYDADDDHSQ